MWWSVLHRTGSSRGQLDDANQTTRVLLRLLQYMYIMLSVISKRPDQGQRWQISLVGDPYAWQLFGISYKSVCNVPVKIRNSLCE